MYFSNTHKLFAGIIKTKKIFKLPLCLWPALSFSKKGFISDWNSLDQRAISSWF